MKISILSFYLAPSNQQALPYYEIWEDYIDLINVDINCPLYFEAPIYKNSKLGSINLHISDTINFEYPIYNSYEVKRKNWNNYFIDFFKDYSSTLSNLFL